MSLDAPIIPDCSPNAIARVKLGGGGPGRLDDASQIAADEEGRGRSMGNMPARIYVSTGLTATAWTLTSTWCRPALVLAGCHR